MIILHQWTGLTYTEFWSGRCFERYAAMLSSWCFNELWSCSAPHRFEEKKPSQVSLVQAHQLS